MSCSHGAEDINIIYIHNYWTWSSQAGTRYSAKTLRGARILHTDGGVTSPREAQGAIHRLESFTFRSVWSICHLQVPQVGDTRDTVSTSPTPAPWPGQKRSSASAAGRSPEQKDVALFALSFFLLYHPHHHPNSL